MKTTTTVVLRVFALGAALAPAFLSAAATRIAFVDPFATARGNAFTATADNPSAVFYNAAGLLQLEGTEVQANVFSISLGYEWDGPAGSAEMDDKFQAVPSFFAAHRFEELPLAIGFGVYAPFALGSDWENDAAFASIPFPPGSPVPYEAELAYLKYHPVIAWQVTDTLSLAAGPTFDDADIEIKTNFQAFLPFSPLPLEFKGDDEAAGYSLSALWQPNEKHSFGLNYQAKTSMKFEGDASGIDASAKLVFPESIVFGYSHRPNEKWNIEFNLDWTNWDRVDSITIDPLGLTYELNWESAFIWELGATRYFGDGWHASAGYTYVENAVPDADFLPIVPDSDRHFFALGVGREYERFSWQLTYQFTYAEDREVTVSNPVYQAFGSPQNGDYDLESQAIAFSLAYRF